jgi:hypothetical protein
VWLYPSAPTIKSNSCLPKISVDVPLILSTVTVTIYSLATKYPKSSENSYSSIVLLVLVTVPRFISLISIGSVSSLLLSEYIIFTFLLFISVPICLFCRIPLKPMRWYWL